MTGSSRRTFALGMLCAVALPASALLTGCATAPSSTPSGPGGHWSGRMALRVEGDSPQNFAALFDLRGTAQTGELRLTSPIGSTLGLARWSPAEAVLDNGSNSRRFESAEELIRAATGADIPLDALFSWLAGQNMAVPGWRADLSQVDAGRINAWRDTPLPRAELRVIFDTP